MREILDDFRLAKLTSTYRKVNRMQYKYCIITNIDSCNTEYYVSIYTHYIYFHNKINNSNI